MVKFFNLGLERSRPRFWEDQRMDRLPPVDEARAPGFTAGLIPDARSGRKSKDQRIPSGHAIARILPPTAGTLLHFRRKKARATGNHKTGGLAKRPSMNSTVGRSARTRRIPSARDARQADVRFPETPFFQSGQPGPADHKRPREVIRNVRDSRLHRTA